MALFNKLGGLGGNRRSGHTGIGTPPEPYSPATISISTQYDDRTLAMQKSGGEKNGYFTRDYTTEEMFDARKGDVVFEWTGVGNSGRNKTAYPKCCYTMNNMDFDGTIAQLEASCRRIGAGEHVTSILRNALVLDQIRIVGISPEDHFFSKGMITKDQALATVVFGKAAITAGDNFRVGDCIGVAIHSPDDTRLSTAQSQQLSNFNLRAGRYALKAVRVTQSTLTETIRCLLAFYMSAPDEFRELFANTNGLTRAVVCQLGRSMEEYCLWSHIIGLSHSVRTGSAQFNFVLQNSNASTRVKAISRAFGLADPVQVLVNAGGDAADFADHMVYVYAAMFNLVTPPSAIASTQQRDIFHQSIVNAKADAAVQKEWNDEAREITNRAIFRGITDRNEFNGCYGLDDRPENKLLAWSVDSVGARAVNTDTLSGTVASFHARLPATHGLSWAQTIFNAGRAIIGTATTSPSIGTGEVMGIVTPNPF